MYSKVQELWRSYACPHGYTGGFYMLHLGISLIGVVVSLVCCVLFSIHNNRDPGLAIWAAFSAVLAATLAATHILARYNPVLAPPERLNQFAIVGISGMVFGGCGMFIYMGRFLFMTTLEHSQISLAIWALITFTWGMALTTFARYYHSQTDECRPIVRQQQDDNELGTSMVYMV